MAKMALPMMETRKEYLDQALDTIDTEFGSAENYLEQALGFDASQLSAAQLKLLQLPVHLSMFVTIGGVDNKTFAFNTAKSLFDHYWIFIETKTEQTLSDPNLFVKILHLCSQEMSKNSSTTAISFVLPICMFIEDIEAYI